MTSASPEADASTGDGTAAAQAPDTCAAAARTHAWDRLRVRPFTPADRYDEEYQTMLEQRAERQREIAVIDWTDQWDAWERQL